MNPGITFAIIAMLAWAFDDFLIGKTTKKFGDSITLFWVACLGTLVLLPFVWQDISEVSFWKPGTGLTILCIALAVTTIAVLADYEALRIGKLSAIDPIYALEIPITLAISYAIIQEALSPYQLSLIALVIAGVCLVSIKSFSGLKKIRWEHGIAMALLSVLFMGGTNFFTAYSGRLTNALVANWFVYCGLTLMLFIYITITKQASAALRAIRSRPKLLGFLALADVVAWSSFTYSATLIPIGLAVAVSEAYIALAVILGLFFNKEKLQSHQLFGIGVTLMAVITLSYIS